MKNLTKNLTIIAAGAVVAGALGTGVAHAEDSPGEGESVRCGTLGWVGDSTSIGLMSGQANSTAEQVESFDIGNSESPVNSAFADKAPSVKHITANFAGGRSLVEELDGTPNGVKAIESLVDEVDCVVIAMGTNDGANIAVGSQEDEASRIASALSAAQGKPVFWLTPVISPNAAVNGYTPESAEKFTASVHDSGKEIMREGDSPLSIIDLSDKTEDDWFTDGIHYTTEADQHRAEAVAEAVEDFNHPESDDTDSAEIGN